MAALKRDEKMVVGTFAILHDAEMRVIQNDGDVCLQFGTTGLIELSLEAPMIDKLLPVLVKAREHLRQIDERTDGDEAELEMQDA